MWQPDCAGISSEALTRFLEEQVYSLPGVERPRDAFSIVLTGSRAVGIHTPTSDVDLDVLCGQDVYHSVQRACVEAGIVEGERSFFWMLKDDDWARYFGEELGRPHFSLTGLDTVREQFRRYDDVAIWIWTNAQVVADPAGRFEHVRSAFDGYPLQVLVRKIKYRWLLAGYWAVDVFPYHDLGDGELLAGAGAILNAVNELLRMFFLVEGRPFPYMEKLMHLAPTTRLGGEFAPFLQQVVGLVVGEADPATTAPERLMRAAELLFIYDKTPECRRFTDACEAAMVAAGVDAAWVTADYANIHELLRGELGPAP